MPRDIDEEIARKAGIRSPREVREEEQRRIREREALNQRSGAGLQREIPEILRLLQEKGHPGVQTLREGRSARACWPLTSFDEEPYRDMSGPITYFICLTTDGNLILATFNGKDYYGDRVIRRRGFGSWNRAYEALQGLRQLRSRL